MRTPRATLGQSRSGFRRVIQLAYERSCCLQTLAAGGVFPGHLPRVRRRGAPAPRIAAERPEGRPAAARESAAAKHTMARMPLAVVSSDEFANHLTPPGHPERLERAHVLDAVAIAWREQGGAVVEPRRGDARGARWRSTIADHVARIASHRGTRGEARSRHVHLAESYEVARLAAGAVLTGVDHALAGDGPALALVRPPGHHAERDRAMGFCLFNNVAVGRRLRPRDGRVARRRSSTSTSITATARSEHLRGRSRVLYVSTHQYPFYPGTGAASEVGHGDGAGDAPSTCRSRRAPATPTTPRASRSDRAGPDGSSPPDLHARVGRLRRARPRSAGADAGDDRRLPARCWRRLRATPTPRRAGASWSSPRAATTCRRWAQCLDATVEVLAGRGDAGPPADRRAAAPAGRASGAARPPRPRWPSSGLLAATAIIGSYRADAVADTGPTDPWPTIRRNPSSRSGRQRWTATGAFEVEDDVAAEVLLPRDVRVPVGTRPRRTRPQLHDWRHRRPPEADAGLQRAAPVRLGRVRHAGRERRHQEQPAPGAVDARQHRAHEGAAAAPRHQLRVGPRDRHVPARLLPLEPVAVHPHAREGPRVSPALDGELVPELPDRARQRAGDRRRVLALRHGGDDARARAVVPAHHAVRRRAARRGAGPARLAREGPDDAAELDREVGGRAGDVPDCRCRRRARRGIEIFTTRIDTIYGATFVLLAPEHPLVDAVPVRSRPGREA